MTKMSETAKRALLDVGTNRQGAKVADGVGAVELYSMGLIGEGMGLTRKGTIARERLVNEAMEAMF